MLLFTFILQALTTLEKYFEIFHVFLTDKELFLRHRDDLDQERYFLLDTISQALVVIEHLENNELERAGEMSESLIEFDFRSKLSQGRSREEVIYLFMAYLRVCIFSNLECARIHVEIFKTHSKSAIEVGIVDFFEKIDQESDNMNFPETQKKYRQRSKSKLSGDRKTHNFTDTLHTHLESIRKIRKEAEENVSYLNRLKEFYTSYSKLLNLERDRYFKLREKRIGLRKEGVVLPRLSFIPDLEVKLDEHDLLPGFSFDEQPLNLEIIYKDPLLKEEFIIYLRHHPKLHLLMPKENNAQILEIPDVQKVFSQAFCGCPLLYESEVVNKLVEKTPKKKKKKKKRSSDQASQSIEEGEIVDCKDLEKNNVTLETETLPIKTKKKKKRSKKSKGSTATVDYDIHDKREQESKKSEEIAIETNCFENDNVVLDTFNDVVRNNFEKTDNEHSCKKAGFEAIVDVQLGHKKDSFKLLEINIEHDTPEIADSNPADIADKSKIKNLLSSETCDRQKCDVKIEIDYCFLDALLEKLIISKDLAQPKEFSLLETSIEMSNEIIDSFIRQIQPRISHLRKKYWLNEKFVHKTFEVQQLCYHKLIEIERLMMSLDVKVEKINREKEDLKISIITLFKEFEPCLVLTDKDQRCYDLLYKHKELNADKVKD